MIAGIAQLAATADASVTCGVATCESSSRCVPLPPAPPRDAESEMQTCLRVRANASAKVVSP